MLRKAKFFWNAATNVLLFFSSTLLSPFFLLVTDISVSSLSFPAEKPYLKHLYSHVPFIYILAFSTE